jgi:hypothetical protein
MVLTKAELLAALQNEVRILLHLADKIDPTALDYRPTPKQRSTLELLRDLSIMGPVLVNLVLCGCAAYCTQLFLYLKAYSREELTTMNLWAGMDARAS